MAGCGSILIDYEKKQMAVGDKIVKQGEVITIDGSAGAVYLGRVSMQQPELTGDFNTLMQWADEVRKLKVYTNADTPTDARTARGFGAQGIGLCRTEHMFFEGDRIVSVRQMILAESVEERQKALAKLLPMQRGDFEEIFRVMDGLPVIIRLLDPPLHEFLPHKDVEYEAVAKQAGISVEKLKAKSAQLHEMNPMLGHRGCRLGITYPEISAMQARAIIEAALNVEAEGKKVDAEIMIPVVAWKQELDYIADIVNKVAAEIKKERGKLPHFKIGTMIELPRAALQAGKLA